MLFTSIYFGLFMAIENDSIDDAIKEEKSPLSV